jgi:hypothetical protein
MVSQGDSGLASDTKAYLAALKKTLHLEAWLTDLWDVLEGEAITVTDVRIGVFLLSILSLINLKQEGRGEKSPAFLFNVSPN